MKKVIYLSLALILGFTLSACKDVEKVVCETGQTLNADGVCEDDPVVVETDEIDPVLAGLTAVSLEVGDTFDKMAGVSATDDTDGTITSSIVVTGTLDLGTAGVYTLTYKVSDAAGNEATGTRTVTVTAPVVVAVPDWTGYGYTVEVTGDTETVTYADINGGAWWNSNAQLPLDSYDGAKDAIKFEFIGTAGHSYVFKMEGDGGAVESPQTVATGELQELVLPLTALAAADRAQFNKIVLFVTTGAASGTIELVSWEAYTLAGLPDAIAPTIAGAEATTAQLNGTFDTAAGVTATDETDGDITSSIVVTGTVDLTVVGDYDLTYTVSDAAGNETVVVRTVSVIDTMWIGYGFDIAKDGTNETITYPAEREEWGNNAQYMVSGIDGTKLGIVFTFTGTEGHEYMFKAEGTGAVEGTVTATGVEQTYTLSLLGLTETQRTELTKLVIFVRTAGVAGSITVAPWEYEAPAATEWLSEGGITVAIDGANEVFTYPVNTGAWWNANAQYLVTDFDETKDAVVFTFTGTAGHVYVIKAEGTKNYEERVLASGVEQTFVLSLASLTEAQRNGIAKLVVFVETGGVEGTITMGPLQYAMVADLADTNAPTVSGIGSKLFNMNETFDQLAGVTATDNVDGDLTSSIVVTGTVDMAVAGTYTLTYTVTDAAGNVAAYPRVITVSATSWLGYGFDVTVSGDNELFTYPINNGAWWDLNAQLKVSGFDGTKEQVVFTFTGTEGHEYLFKAEGTRNTELSVIATGELQSFVLPLSSFTVEQREAIKLFVVFNKSVGTEGTLEIAPWTYEVPVVVEETIWTGEGMTVAAADGDNETISYPINGGAWWNNNAQQDVADFDGTKDALVFTFTGTAGDVLVFKVEGAGVAKEEAVVSTGVEQTFAFDLSSLTEENRDKITKLVIFSKSGDAGSLTIAPWAYGIFADLPDTNGPTLDGVGNELFNMNETFDQLAGVTATDGVDGDLTSSIVVTGTVDMAVAGTYTLTYTVTDAAGNTTAYPRVITVSATSWLGYGFDIAVTGDTETFTYPINNGAWWDLNAQLKVTGFDGTKTQIAFTFTGTEGHEYLFKAEGQGWAKEASTVAKGYEETFVLDLSSLSEAQRATADLLIIFNKSVGTEGTLEIAPWTYEAPIVITEWNGEGGIVVSAAGDNELVTYPVNNGAWWTANAQTLITDFDVTKDAVVFTFTGTAGHEYLFKAEGSTNYEESVLASGVEQTFVLSLATLTEAQRAGIAKLVLFVKTGGVEGTVMLSPWAYGMLADLPDTNGPTVAGASSKLLNMNEAFDQVAGVTAIDNVDGDLTSSIVITGTVDLAVPGDYVLTYTVTDAAGNTTAYPRVITVSATAWLGYGWETELNASGTELLTYPTNANNWWDLNAQLKVSGFDGTKDQVVFTFTGTEGHEYVFKAEGNGAVEASVVATGFEQSYVLSLSGLSETQRNEIDLFVLFTKTKDSAGMIEVVSWDYVTPTVTPDLFFSEYIEGTSNNKALEIYNPTGADVDLTAYSIVIYKNGATEASATYDMTGTLLAGDVFVICADQMTEKTECDVLQAYDSSATSADVTHFNGDDALVIVKDGVIIDVFGVVGTDPGSKWVVGTGATANFTLVRIPAVVKGVTYFNTNEWTVFPQNTYTELGSHSQVTVIPEMEKVDASGLLFQANVGGNGHYGIEKPASVNPTGWDTGKYTVEIYDGTTLLKTFSLDNDGTVVFIQTPGNGELTGLAVGDYDIHVIMLGNGTTHQDSDPKVFTITFAG